MALAPHFLHIRQLCTAFCALHAALPLPCSPRYICTVLAGLVDGQRCGSVAHLPWTTASGAALVAGSLPFICDAPFAPTFTWRAHVCRFSRCAGALLLVSYAAAGRAATRASGTALRASDACRFLLCSTAAFLMAVYLHRFVSCPGIFSFCSRAVHTCLSISRTHNPILCSMPDAGLGVITGVLFPRGIVWFDIRMEQLRVE